MSELLNGNVLFSIFITLGTYQVGVWCQRRWKNPIFNPILISVIMVAAILKLFNVPNQGYQAGNTGIGWLLTPATVCLAIPLYRQIHSLRNKLLPITVGVLAGTTTNLAFIFIFAWIFDFESLLTISLLPKSVTTAIGIAVTENVGGISALTTAAIIATGILGSLFGTTFCKIFCLTHPVACGVAFGTSSHVIGTTKAAELNELAGAVSSLSLIITGVITVVLIPLLVPFC